jgi:hypothetical protein
MNPLILLFLLSLLSKARTRRDRFKVLMVIMTVISQQNGRPILADIRRMDHSTSPDVLVFHLLASLREEPTGVNDPHNSDMIRRILWGNEKQFRRMFRLSRHVFEAVLAELVRFPPIIRPTTFILPGLGVSCDELGSADSDPLSLPVVVTELAEGMEVAGGRAGPVVTGVDPDEEEADKVTTGVFEFNLGGGFKCGT